MYLCQGVFFPDFVLIPAHTFLGGVLFQTCPDLSSYLHSYVCLCAGPRALLRFFASALCVFSSLCTYSICLGRVRSVKICVNICQCESVFFFPSSLLSTICLGVGVSFLQFVLRSIILAGASVFLNLC